MRPERVFEIIEGSARAVKEKYEHVLSAHEKQYGEPKIYANLHEVIKKNHAHLQELINDFDNRVDEEGSFRPSM